MLYFIESLTPALCFLLILQFIHCRPPEAVFWLVMAIPVIGGSSFIYGALHFDELCLRQSYCFPASSLKTLYHLASTGLIFLLLIMYYSRLRRTVQKEQELERHRYWLIISLVTLSLLLMAIDLASVTFSIPPENVLIAATTVRIGFIYLVLTSLFKAFEESVSLDIERIPTLTQRRKKPGDGWIVEKIEQAMTHAHAYRECATILALSELLAIPEHQLSRVINTHFETSFSDFINRYRLEEAQQRLRDEETPVTTIAYEVGFGSIPSFNRVFKEKTGMTPTAYRKRHGSAKPLKATS